jgi:hypothetical protein
VGASVLNYYFECINHTEVENEVQQFVSPDLGGITERVAGFQRDCQQLAIYFRKQRVVQLRGLVRDSDWKGFITCANLLPFL